ncbi:hypothetical protein [Fulvivirga sp.]|uniref:hypothetical protein n=1 Tax=Fulvivirga sp. TaxID=1931237 RepID=UPI0032EC285E
MRQQIVSTNQLKVFQAVCLIPSVLIIGFFFYMLVLRFKIFYLGQVGLYAYLFYRLYYNRILRLKTIDYDDENIFVVEKGQEIVIPFVDIKEIKLRSLIGTHSIELYRDLGFGEEFYFKSSLWYPLNFKKVDDAVYQLQSKIRRAKQNYTPENYRSLGS